MKAVPHKRQIALFGATISDEINQLKTKYMNNPAFEKSEAHVDDTLLKQYYYRVDQKENSLYLYIFSGKKLQIELLYSVQHAQMWKQFQRTCDQME